MKLYYSNHLTNKIRERNTSHLLLEKVLKEYYPFYAAETVRRTDGGKPYLESPDAPVFSISHTGTLWLCVVTDHTIGIDAEHLNRRIVRPLKLAERYFSEEEFRFIASAPDGEKTAEDTEDSSPSSADVPEEFPSPTEKKPAEIERFQWERIIPGGNTDAWTVSERLLLIWTRKEAFLKYTGEGLGKLTGSRSVMKEPEGLSIRSYRNGTVLLSVCAEETFRKEAITEYIDLDNGKVHKNVRFFRR